MLTYILIASVSAVAGYLARPLIAKAADKVKALGGGGPGPRQPK